MLFKPSTDTTFRAVRRFQNESKENGSLDLPRSTVLVPNPRDVLPKSVMLEDLFYKKSQEKIVEAAPLFEFVDSGFTGDERSVTLDSYDGARSTINPI